MSPQANRRPNCTFIAPNNGNVAGADTARARWTTDQGEASVTVTFDVPARMRDGAVLRADVYRPEGSGPWPTLLTRTPYGKHRVAEAAWCGLDPIQAAKRGFIVVVQDTRGRFASDGDWDPFRFERADGYDSIEWAARLPGSNGYVGTYGGSYCGNTQWMPAIDRPPSLGAISPAMTWSDPGDGLFSRGGAVELGLALRWTLETGIDHLSRLGLSCNEIQRCSDSLMDDWDQLADHLYWQLPVTDLPALRHHNMPDLGSIRALDEPSVAQWCRVAGSHGEVTVPSLHTAGWHDIFLQGTLDNYQAMAALGRPARLIVGPWTHHAFGDPVGELSFGIRASRDGVPVHREGDWNDVQLTWFRRNLIPGPPPDRDPAEVRMFVMGRNAWRDESTWPLRHASAQYWFLHGDRSLSPAPPAPGPPPSQFTYDPRDPAPTLGGHGVLTPAHSTGPVDQASVELRDDVLVFTSAPLPRDVEVTGPVRVILHARSSAPSTDFVARLCDVHADGRSFNLCDGIVRVPAGANECRRHDIDLWSTSNVFLRGHRLRLHVTSSSFPRWDRNLNTGNQRQTHQQPARQEIFHSADSPSYVELPVV